MSNQEILTKAIEKAVEGGWHEAHDYTVRGGHIYDLDNRQSDDLVYYNLFARALWGERLVGTGEYGESWFDGDDEHGAMEGGEEILLPAWQYHLQQMVIAEDPIKYLGEHI